MLDMHEVVGSNPIPPTQFKETSGFLSITSAVRPMYGVWRFPKTVSTIFKFRRLYFIVTLGLDDAYLEAMNGA